MPKLPKQKPVEDEGVAPYSDDETIGSGKATGKVTPKQIAQDVIATLLRREGVQRAAEWLDETYPDLPQGKRAKALKLLQNEAIKLLQVQLKRLEAKGWDVSQSWVDP